MDRPTHLDLSARQDEARFLVVDSRGSTSPFSSARVVGDLVVAGVPGDLALARAARLHELMGLAGVSVVTTASLRRAVHDLGNTIDGPPTPTIGDALRDSPFIFATTRGTTKGITLLGGDDGKVTGGDPPKERGRVTVKSDVTLTLKEVIGPPKKPTGEGPPHTQEKSFTVEFSASDVSECHWLQFFWVELFYTLGTGRAAQAKKLHAPNGDYDTTTTQPPSGTGLHVDTYQANPTSLYPDERPDGWDQGPDGSDVLGFGDSPGTDIDDDMIKGSGGATKIEEIIHFQDFLICNGSVIYEVDLDLTYTWDAGTKSTTRTVNKVKGKACSKLDDAHQKAISSQFGDKFNPATGAPK